MWWLLVFLNDTVLVRYPEDHILSYRTGGELARRNNVWCQGPTTKLTEARWWLGDGNLAQGLST
jgi:hypothetical protein